MSDYILRVRRERGPWLEIPAIKGDTGFSPTVAVTDIEGGHRVTITDEDGEHAFDVLDGQGGGGGTGDHNQLTNRDAANQHPMSAITGLQYEFGMISDAFGDVFDAVDGLRTGKQSTIADLATIRSGAAKGATAVQPETGKGLFSGNYDDLKNKPTIPSAVTESTVSGWGFTKNTGTYSKPSGGIPKTDLASAVRTSLGKADTALQAHQDISGKQDVISDLPAIRSGAALGATALQSVPSEYVTETELNNAISAAITNIDVLIGSGVIA